jgi:ADP-ribosylglycohydrolase
VRDSVHANIHGLAFAPGDSSKLWPGCDGGDYDSTNPSGNGAAMRAAPIGGFFSGDPSRAHPRRSSLLLTHAHREGQAGAMAAGRGACATCRGHDGRQTRLNRHLTPSRRIGESDRRF